MPFRSSLFFSLLLASINPLASAYQIERTLKGSDAANALLESGSMPAVHRFSVGRLELAKRQNMTGVPTSLTSSTIISSMPLSNPISSSAITGLPTTSIQPTSVFPPSSTPGLGIVGGFPTSSSSSAISSTSPSGPAVIVPVVSTMVESGHTVVATTFRTQEATGSVVVPVVTTNAKGKPTTASQVVPGVAVTATDSRGHITTSFAPLYSGDSGSSISGDVTTTDQFGNTVVWVSPTAGKVITATDRGGRVVTTTYHPRGRPVETTLVLFSTLPNGGGQTLITRTAYVVPNAATTAGAEDNIQSQTSGTPGLQTGNVGATSRKVGAEAFALAVGVVGVAWAL